jgi:hypothetical protein
MRRGASAGTVEVRWWTHSLPCVFGDLSAMTITQKVLYLV